MRFRVRCTMILTLLIAWPCLLPAQGDRAATLTIRLDGLSSARLVEATPTGRRDLAQVVASAPTSLPMAAINAGKGTRTRVLLDPAANEPTLVLQSSEVVDRQCAAREKGDAGACDEVAVLIGGRDADMTLSLIDGVINVIIRQPWPRFTVGVELSHNSFTSLEDVACDQPGVSSCTADDNGIGYGGFVEYGLTPGLGLGLRYERTEFAVDIVNGSEFRHDVSVTRVEGYGHLRPFGTGRFSPFGYAGWGWYQNRSEVLEFGDLVGERDQSGGRTFGGIGVDMRVGDMLGFRFSTGYATGGRNDADNAFRSSFAATFRF